MTRRLAVALMALVLLTAASGSVVFAHDGHDHKVMGTITMAAADHVMLKSTDNENVTIMVTKDTKVTRNKQAMKAQDIEVGTRVVVTAVSEKDKMMATQIEVGAEPKSGTK